MTLPLVYVAHALRLERFRALTSALSFHAMQVGNNSHTPFVTSQFHGCNIAMSWFLIVQNIQNHTCVVVEAVRGDELP